MSETDKEPSLLEEGSKKEQISALIILNSQLRVAVLSLPQSMLLGKNSPDYSYGLFCGQVFPQSNCKNNLKIMKTQESQDN